jgi:hypothetical protein
VSDTHQAISDLRVTTAATATTPAEFEILAAGAPGGSA